MKPEYLAVEEKDGTYTILDVPIFSEVEEGQKNAPEKIGVTWMSRAIDAAAQLERGQKYLPPLHIGHHGQDPNVTAAGHFRPRRVAYLKIDGETRPVITADLVKLSKETFDDVMAGKYPYRSVEILDWNEPRINHLALLSHREPFFKFPLLNGDTVKLSTMRAGDQATAVDGKKVAILFCETTEETVKKPAVTPEKPAKKKSLFQRLKDRVEAAFAASADEVEEEEVETGEEPSDAEFEAAIEELANLPDDEFEAVMSELEGEAGEEFGEISEEDLENMSEEELEELAADLGIDEDGNPSDDSPQPAELDPEAEGRLSAVESELGQMKVARKAADLVAEAEADLEGYFVDEATRERIATFAAMGKKPLATFLASFKEHATKEPELLDAELAATDPALKKLNLSPELQEKAISFSRDYDEAKARGFVSEKVTKEQFIQAQLAATAGQEE